MSTGNQPPSQWSYSPGATAERPRNRRRLIVAGAATAIVVLLVAALLFWLARPTVPLGGVIGSDAAASESRAPLNDKPPTVILNGLDVRSLYPPGYVDFDRSKKDHDLSDFGPEDIDFSLDYATTSSPSGCERDPIFEASAKRYEPGRYRRYPILLLMYPASDAGGNDKGSEPYSVQVFPQENPDHLDEVRQWYNRCNNAEMTVTGTRDGRVAYQESDRLDYVVSDAPTSEADDAFFLNNSKDEVCTFIGRIRGMIVVVDCPAAQRDAGAQLFRTVVSRIRTI